MTSVRWREKRSDGRPQNRQPCQTHPTPRKCRSTCVLSIVSLTIELFLSVRMLKLDRMRSETSRSQPHSRAQSPYTYTPAVQRHHSARADPSRGWFTANSDVLNVGKGTPGQPESRSARFVGKPTFDALNDNDEDDEGETFITATRVEEPRLARPAREAPYVCNDDLCCKTDVGVGVVVAWASHVRIVEQASRSASEANRSATPVNGPSKYAGFSGQMASTACK